MQTYSTIWFDLKYDFSSFINFIIFDIDDLNDTDVMKQLVSEMPPLNDSHQFSPEQEWNTINAKLQTQSLKPIDMICLYIELL